MISPIVEYTNGVGQPKSSESPLFQRTIIYITVMSVYSGFATRKDQTNYNQLLAKLIRTLIAHLLEFNPAFPSPRSLAYSKIIIKLRQYDEHKYLEPKFSELLEPLARLVGLTDAGEQVLERTGSKWATPSNDQRNKTPSSSSQNQFRSRKISQGAGNMTPKQNYQHSTKPVQKTAHKASLVASSKIEQQRIETPERKNSKYMSFYASQSQKQEKVNKNYNKKLHQLQKMKQQGVKFGAKFNRFKTMGSANYKLNQREQQPTLEHNCLDLKSVKQAQSYLEECRKRDIFERVTKDITFSQI